MNHAIYSSDFIESKDAFLKALERLDEISVPLVEEERYELPDFSQEELVSFFQSFN